MIPTRNKVFIKILSVLLLLMATHSESFAAAGQNPEDNGLMLLQSCRAALAQTTPVDDKANPFKVLSEQMVAMSCIGFVDGMMAMNALYQGLVIDPDKRGRQYELGLFCTPPAGVTVFEAIRVVVKHLEGVALRDLESSQRRMFVLVALAREFPCKANQPK